MRDLTRCTPKDIADALLVKTESVETWIERGAPTDDDGRWLNFEDLAGWIMAEQPTPDTDPHALEGEAEARWYCSEIERMAVRMKQGLYRTAEPGLPQALAFLRVELTALANMVALEHQLPAGATLSLNQDLQKAVDHAAQRAISRGYAPLSIN